MVMNAPRFFNGQSMPLASVPEQGIDIFRETVLCATEDGARLSALFGEPLEEGRLRLWAVLAADMDSELIVTRTVVGKEWESLTPDCPQAHLFEREIAEQFGARPLGHPWLKPVRFQPALRGKSLFAEGSDPAPGVAEHFRVEGDEIHEVAVGPVHAGVIEPGHFRFQCRGEEVLHLEITLGYQHRGVERALMAGPDKRTIHFMETLAGDTTVGHATAYCQAVEGLSESQPSARAMALRAVALELERMANHTGDLGALAGDVGFLPVASFCGRLRGDLLNMTALLCGNRFGRGLARPGGVGFDLDPARVSGLLKRLESAMKDLTGALQLLFVTPSVLARFESTGVVSAEDAEGLGLVGVAARASGLQRDIRFDFPSGAYQFSQVPVEVWRTGDVFARAYVRWLEIQHSAEFIRKSLEALPGGAVMKEAKALRPESLAVSLTEGWRGEICHVAITNKDGSFARYKVVDPSFHNWTGLALALRGQQISDFPLCNKSFNLSYCGHDL